MKHGSIGMPRTDAQTDSPLTLIVPGGSLHEPDRSGATDLDGARDRQVALDATGAAGAVETVVGECLADHETPRGVDAKRLRQRRPCHKQGRCDRHNTHEHWKSP